MLIALISLLVASNIALVGMLLAQRHRFRARMAEAELRRLRNQLNPHFLFNTLNAISELGYDEPEAADRAITRLSGLLRKSLHPTEEIALKDEIEFVEDYLSLQRMLTRETLDVSVDVDPTAVHARVPTMILQPLVENALTHGRNPSGAGRIVIAAQLADGTLTLSVADNGTGPDAAPPRRPGIGLSNVRARLAHLHGDRAAFVLEKGNEEGAIARITLPFRELP